jgi:hypothetical protein
MASEMKPRWLDFFLVDASDPTDKTLALEHFITIGEIDIKSVKDMVDVVVMTCIAKKGHIRSLRISGHGNSTGAYIGGDWISTDTLKCHEKELKKLNSCLSVKVSLVTFDSCQTGGAITLLQRLSKLWRGVRVKAFQENQRPDLLWPNDEGPAVVCKLKQCTVRK